MFLLHQIPLSGFLHGTMSSFLYYLAPSGPPLNITTRTVNSTTIQVTWAPPAPEHQNGIITLYNINVTVSETKSNFILNTSTTSLNVTGLHPHYTYTLAVSAVTIRPGTYSEPQIITTPEDCKFLFLTFANGIVQGKRPWPLTAQMPNIGCGQLQCSHQNLQAKGHK